MRFSVRVSFRKVKLFAEFFQIEVEMSSSDYQWIHRVANPNVLDPAVSDIVYEADHAYQSGQLDKAIQITFPIANGDSDSAAALVAGTILFASHIASGKGELAYNDMVRVIRGCRKGLACSENPRLHGASMLCAMRVEALLVAQIFDTDSFDKSVDKMPPEIKPYLGYLLSSRAMRHNRSQMAIGISYACLHMLDRPSELSSILLNLVMASGHMIQGNREAAKREFMHAWTTGKESGIVMPFVELNHALLGLPRHCLTGISNDLGDRMRAHVRAFHKGWYGLRRCCGLSEAGSELTPLELNVILLAVNRMLNKEIAVHLHISENTVKRNLSNAYRKLEVSNRAEAQRVVFEAIYFAKANIA